MFSPATVSGLQQSRFRRKVLISTSLIMMVAAYLTCAG